MKKITQGTIAENLNLSRQTVVRVLAGDRNVAQSTRKLVINELNKNGYYTRNLSKQKNIVLNIGRPASWLHAMKRQFIAKFTSANINFIETNYEADPSHFSREIAKADTVVFFRMLDEKVLALAHEVNPDIFRINLISNGTRKAEISIEPDNYLSGKLAADYLYSRGFRDFVIYISKNNIASLTRAKGFLAEYAFDRKECRVDPVLFSLGDVPLDYQIHEDLVKRKLDGRTAFFCTISAIADKLTSVVHEMKLEVPASLSVLNHDSPEDSFFPQLPFDYLSMKISDLISLARYFVTCRPLFPDQFNIAISPEFVITAKGSVGEWKRSVQ